MKKKIAIAAAVLLSVVAVAQVQQLDLNVSQRLMALTGGLLVGPTSLMNSNTQINDNRVTRSLGTSATINLPFDAGCQDAAIGLPGARSGDACSVGIPTPGSGNAYSCFVSDAGEVTVRQCPAGSDSASQLMRVRLTSSTSN